MASNLAKRGRSSPDDRLAFLALTYTIDQWSYQIPHLADKLLEDRDQQLLSELYVAHLMPAARSFWWNGDNYHRAMDQLLKEKYPVVKVVAWKWSGPKASNLLKIWREDAALLYTDLVGPGREDNVPGGEADQEVDEETDVISEVSQSYAAELDEVESDEEVEECTRPDIKRKASKTLGRIETSKKARVRSVYDQESSEDDIFEIRHRPKMRPMFSTPRPAATALMTPPQSSKSTLTIVIASDSEDEDLAATTSRPATGKPDGPVAASDPAPLSLTPVQTVASIEPAEEPTQKHNCLTAIRETIDRVAESCDTFLPQERSEASRQLKKLELKLERLGKTAKGLREAIGS
ncbi:hypothetical protein CSHISOI_04351 [Colletotrichum shisoi]|uniref:Uncharacterized protein n=1 Tax=Colletotrichum shisoi TaxID=2078593 RepID=A0A5Q4BVK2_9PEZI|nr:hypothetical protein CSHISOI_04351 [Colletotrichum shisoi]